MKKDIVTSAIGIVVLTILLGILYPLLIAGIGQVAFEGNADGQRIYLHGTLIGAKLIGQPFTDAKGGAVARYFQTRPSATTPPDNAAGTAFSNLGPNSVATEQALAKNLDAYLSLERPYDPGLTAGQVPVDAVDNSASGIDPDISPANADIQAHRVAATRQLPLSTVDGLIARYTHGRGLGFSGESGVNVLELNLAIDREASR